MELKDKIHDMLVDAGYSDTVRVSANIATLSAAHYGKEIERLKEAIQQAVTILSEKRPNTPGLGGPLFILKQALKDDTN